MLLADITISTEAAVAIAGIGGALISAIGMLFKMVVDNRSAELKAMEMDRNSWKEMALEGMERLDQAVAKHRKDSHRPIPEVVALAPIVPEHNSPVTPQQQETADIGTVRAKLVAATLALGLEPRKILPAEESKTEASDKEEIKESK